jgi:hypothetical protein
MIAHPQTQFKSLQEYLEWKLQQPIKYDSTNESVFDMTRGTLHHNFIALNLRTLLKNLPGVKRFGVFLADTKVGISRNKYIHYLGNEVTGDSYDPIASKVVYNPESCCRSTFSQQRRYRTWQKFNNCYRIDTLRGYTLIKVQIKSEECYRLNEKRRSEYTTCFLKETDNK